ncbi:MAG: PQQ-dependent sugar dehydrogenase [Pseudomonadota bacterium]
MRLNIWLTSSLAIALASCGGSDSAAPPVTPPTNRAPVFTSAATASVPENTTGTVYTATATDADGNAVTFSISGGADAARFRIAAGALAFVNPPDFENPDDADANNIYLVQLSASDGTATTTLNLAFTVTNQGSDLFHVRRVGTGFTQPVFVKGIPNGFGRVFVVEKGGRIKLMNTTSGGVLPTPFLDVSSQVSTSGERGLLGLAFDPNFTTTHIFYIYMINTTGNIEVRKYRTMLGNDDVADPTSSDVILTIPHPGADNHNGGWIDIGPDGNLYIGTGDGGGSGDPGNNAQNASSLLGKMLRIDPRSDAFPTDPLRDYAIPATNPYATSGGSPEIWLSGLRNPFRASFDTTGNLYIGDVGQDAIEEIDLVPAGANGLNFGWRLREGSQPYNGGANSALFTPPVAEYSHGSGALQGNSITGGYVYRGPVEALRGQYFFADFVSGNIWSVPVSRLIQGQTLASSAFTPRRASFIPDAGTINNIASFGTDEGNALYIVDYDGDIFIVEPGTQGSL